MKHDKGMWRNDWTRSFAEQERIRARQRRIEVGAIVVSYLIAIGASTWLFIHLSTRG